MRPTGVSVLFSFLFLTLFAGCASTYSFTSVPSDTKVYYVDRDTEKRYFLGDTPFQYKKGALPEDRPFIVVFEKQGYIPTDVPVAPIDNAHTLINVNLKRDPAGTGSKADTREIQEALRSLVRARNFITASRYHDAIIELDKVIATNPDLPEAFMLKGTAYYLLRDLPSAKDSWKQALKLDPNLEELQAFLKKNNLSLD